MALLHYSTPVAGSSRVYNPSLCHVRISDFNLCKSGECERELLCFIDHALITSEFEFVWSSCLSFLIWEHNCSFSMLWPVFCWVVYVYIYSLIRKSWIWIFVGYIYARYHFQLVAYLLTSFVTSFNNQMFSTLSLSLIMPCAFLILLLEIILTCAHQGMLWGLNEAHFYFSGLISWFALELHACLAVSVQSEYRLRSGF